MKAARDSISGDAVPTARVAVPLDEYIKRVVDAAPPLSPDQLSRLAILLQSRSAS